MIITQEKIENLYRLYDEISVLEREANEAVNHAKSFGKNEVEVVRKNGKKDKVKESLLWEEVWQIGKLSEGYEILEKKYPTAFGKSAELQKKHNELSKFSVAELGIDINRIKLSDIIRLVQALVKQELKNGQDTGKA
jgi:hypothetical protein